MSVTLELGLVNVHMISRVRVRVRIAIMHIVLRCRTGSLSCCLEVDFGVEVATWSCPRGLELLVGSGSWWWAMVHRAQI